MLIINCYFSHSSNEEDVLKILPIEIFATVIHTTLLQQQLEQCNGLLCAIGVHLGHVQIINENQQLFAYRCVV